eukprot:g284.t1
MTGGPCGGKSSCLTFIENHLQELGFTVFMVPEASTLLKTSGCGFPVSASKEVQLAWEESKMRLQIALEDLFTQLAENAGGKVVILNDRGLMDSKFFAGDEDFEDILTNNGWTEELLLDRYDMVIHLVSAAIGAEAFYTTEGNVARWETPEQAAQQDNALKLVWMGHRHHFTVDNAVDFNQKIRNATEIICGQIGVAAPGQYKKTFVLEGTVPRELVELDKPFLLTNKIKDDVIVYKLTTTFLTDASDGSNKVLRRREIGGVSSYVLTTEVKDSKGNRVFLENRLRRAMYQSLLRQKDPKLPAISRKRIVFICENHLLHELDIHSDGLVRLIVATSTADEYQLPQVLAQSMKAVDVSNDPAFTSLRQLCARQGGQSPPPARAFA